MKVFGFLLAAMMVVSGAAGMATPKQPPILIDR